MAQGVLFIGWGEVITGRELKSFEIFNEAIQFYTQAQQQGTIESFQPVALEPHGGDLGGFILITGDRDKLEQWRYSQEFIRLTARASMVVRDIGIVGGWTGQELESYFQILQQQSSELG